MNERIKSLRKKLGLSQTEFGAKIGVKQTTIAGYENGTRAPIDAVLASICREFDVNETWLRTGEGEMFIPQSRDEEIAAFVADVLKGESPDFRRRLIAVLARMTPDEWDLLERKARELMEEAKKDETEP